MLQTLLADRFKMVVRHDTKEQPVYAILVGKNGSKLQKSSMDEKDCADKTLSVGNSTLCHIIGGGIGQGLHGQAVTISDVWLIAAGSAVSDPASRKSGRKCLQRRNAHGTHQRIVFGAVPLRQVFQTDPHQIVKSGFLTKAGRRMTVRDVLLVAQVAICAVLVTSSLVAVRGLIRSLHGNFGFEPQHAMVIETGLGMDRGDKIPEIQKRILNASASTALLPHLN